MTGCILLLRSGRSRSTRPDRPATSASRARSGSTGPVSRRPPARLRERCRGGARGRRANAETRGDAERLLLDRCHDVLDDLGVRTPRGAAMSAPHAIPRRSGSTCAIRGSSSPGVTAARRATMTTRAPSASASHSSATGSPSTADRSSSATAARWPAWKARTTRRERKGRDAPWVRDPARGRPREAAGGSDPATRGHRARVRPGPERHRRHSRRTACDRMRLPAIRGRHGWWNSLRNPAEAAKTCGARRSAETKCAPFATST